MDKVGIVGLGYVGLPLAVEFGKLMETIGFDIDKNRIQELVRGHDRTKEVSAAELAMATKLSCSAALADLKNVNYFIVTVPTPVDAYKQPDLRPLISASKTVGQVLKKDDIVIYESTVYPGCTEEVCVPVLEEVSGLMFNRDFFCGYSPGWKNITILWPWPIPLHSPLLSGHVHGQAPEFDFGRCQIRWFPPVYQTRRPTEGPHNPILWFQFYPLWFVTWYRDYYKIDKS